MLWVNAYDDRHCSVLDFFGPAIAQAMPARRFPQYSPDAGPKPPVRWRPREENVEPSHSKIDGWLSGQHQARQAAPRYQGAARLHGGGRMKTALDRLALVTAVAIIAIFALMLGLLLFGWLPS